MRYLLLFVAPYIFLNLRSHSKTLALFATYAYSMWVMGNWMVYGIIDVCCILAAPVMAIKIHEKFTEKGFADIIGYCAVFNLVLGFLECAHVKPDIFSLSAFHWPTPDPRFIGLPIATFGNQTILGPLTAMGLYWALCKKNYPLAFAFAVSVYLSTSAMTFGSAAVGVWFWYYWDHPKQSVAIGLLGILACFGFVCFTKSEFFNFDGRLMVWPFGWKAHLSAPWLGHGPGSWLGRYEEWKVDGQFTWDKLHNEFLQCLVEYGRVGFTIAAGSVISFLRFNRSISRYSSGFFIILLSNCFGNFPMHIAPYGLIFCWTIVVMESDRDWSWDWLLTLAWDYIRAFYWFTRTLIDIKRAKI